MRTGRFFRLVTFTLACTLALDPGYFVWAQSQKSGLGAGSGEKGKGKSGTSRQTTAGRQLQGRVGVQAQFPAEDTLPGGQVLSLAVRPDQYVLGPGDGLAITLWGEYDASYDVKISPDGKISLPTIGSLNIKELRLTEADALIQSEVHRYYRNVKSAVSLTSLRVFQVLVLGEVQMPGGYLATPVKRVSDVVMQAGGVLTSGSSRHIQVKRDGKVVAYGDLSAFLRGGEDVANPFLHDGDVVFVPSMGSQRVIIYAAEIEAKAQQGGALTETSVPYTLEMKEGERLASVISELGGIDPWWDLEGIIIQRQSQSPEGTLRIPVNLQRYYLDRDESQNVVLEGGDQIYIPSGTRRVLVAGAVGKVGAYTYIPGKSADAYVAQAGGALLVADIDRSIIRRVDGTIEPYSSSTEINNGDSVIVLEKIFKTWQDYFALVGTVSGVILGMIGFYAAFTNFGR